MEKIRKSKMHNIIRKTTNKMANCLINKSEKKRQIATL